MTRSQHAGGAAHPRRARLQGKYKLARLKYNKALKTIDQALDLETAEQFAAASAAKLACCVNMALCAQKEDEWGEAITWCNKAIRCGGGGTRGLPLVGAVTSSTFPCCPL